VEAAARPNEFALRTANLQRIAVWVTRYCRSGVGAALTTYRAVLHHIQTYADRQFPGIAVSSATRMSRV